MKAKHNFVGLLTAAYGSRGNGEKFNHNYLIEIADEVLGEGNVEYHGGMMFRHVTDALKKVNPSALIIPQGHADKNAISNLETHFGGSLPDIPIFEAFKNTGDFCNLDGSLINPSNKEKKDSFVQEKYRDWLTKNFS